MEKRNQRKEERNEERTKDEINKFITKRKKERKKERRKERKKEGKKKGKNDERKKLLRAYLSSNFYFCFCLFLAKNESHFSGFQIHFVCHGPTDGS